MNQDIREIFKEISKKCSCPSCGAGSDVFIKKSHEDGYKCLYCGNVNLELKDIEEKLCDLLSGMDNYSEDLLLGLYEIRNLDIDYVNKILKDNNYEDFYSNKYDDIMSRVKEGKIKEQDYKYLFSFIKTNYRDSKLQIIGILVKELILGKLGEVSLEDKKILIKEFTESFMKTRVNNPKCEYDNLKGCSGGSIYNLIKLNTSDVEWCLIGSHYLELFMLVFHECTHTVQESVCRKGDVCNYLTLLQTKEMIIRNFENRHGSDNYYKDNYSKISYEVEAYYCEKFYVIDFFKKMGISISSQNMEILKDRMNLQMQLIEDENRIMNGEELTVDEIFDSIPQDSVLLKNYPLLGLQYKDDNGVLVKKNNLELQQDYDERVKLVKNAREKNMLDVLYTRLAMKAPKSEQVKK